MWPQTRQATQPHTAQEFDLELTAELQLAVELFTLGMTHRSPTMRASNAEYSGNFWIRSAFKYGDTDTKTMHGGTWAGQTPDSQRHSM